MRRPVSYLMIAVLALVAGCGDDKPSGAPTATPAPLAKAPDPAPAPKADEEAPVPAAKPMEISWKPTEPDAKPYDPKKATATVSGKATFKGDAIPKRKKLDMSKDDKCQNPAARTEEEIVDKETKGIQNVFVFVKSGHEKQKFEKPATSVQINQEGCVYKPHVFGMMPGQTIDILNSDDTTHNIHALPSKSKEFNFTQNKKGDKRTETIENAEFPVKIKCDIHPWMGAWVFVLPHTLHGVSDDKGKFALPALEPGDYEIGAWHETYGEAAAQKVSVKDGDQKEIEFVFEKK